MLNFRNNRTGATVGRGGQAGNGNRQNDAYLIIREKVQRRLLAQLNPGANVTNDSDVRRSLERIFQEVLAEVGLPLSRSERTEMFEQIVADLLGLGPLEPLLRDNSISEILVNGPDQVFIERNGILEEAEVRFQDEAEVLRIIDRIVAPLGRRVDGSSPMVDARLPDGSRVNVVIPPLSLVGPCISIRKFVRHIMSVEDLVASGAISQEMIDFLRVAVLAKLNILVSGGTSTGKTTLLNVLSSFIPDRERIITIEDAAELRLQQRHVIPLEARPPNVEGKGQITIRQLVINALRMRPDRIVVGEVRGGEALDMLQAMNTGHEGSLTTVHANGPRDALRRVETMVLMAGMELPLRAIREQIASAFDLVIQLERMPDGSRKVVQIAEVQGMEGDVIVMQDIFHFVRRGMKDGRVQGHFSATGIRPKFIEKIEAAGFQVSPDLFMPTQAPKNRKKRW